MKSVLIANRGEIAVRIVRACRDYGLTAVAVYADTDADALHVRLADQAWALNGATPAETYLDGTKIIALARKSGADAIHPGYGFLSESSEFAREVIAAGLTWIGATPASIDLLGDKVAARRVAAEVGAPLVSGSSDSVATSAEAYAFAEEFGLPIVIKAAFGGGGRGLRIARNFDEIAHQFDAAVRESIAAFGRGECFVEQYLERPRHIEAQVIGDSHGNVVVIGTRDCSLQRRNQKLVEEAPAPFLTADQRQRIHIAAADICRAAEYQGVATVEFLLSVDGRISFLEVNTRLQVDHPVTEETTGVDLVVEQFRVADGLALSVTETPEPCGHSLEFRINAEDPSRGFLPTPGLITRFTAPAGPGIRLDSGVEQGSVISERFDSMMAKLVVTGATRDIAIARARRALAEFEIEGIPTVLGFHRAVLDDNDFAGPALRVHTQWIETTFANRLPPGELAELPAEPEIASTWIEIDGRRSTLRMPLSRFSALAALGTPAPGHDSVTIDAATSDQTKTSTVRSADILSPVSGVFTKWLSDDGTCVSGGDPIAVLEAMKMETTVLAPHCGTLRHCATPGDPVRAGSLLAQLH